MWSIIEYILSNAMFQGFIIHLFNVSWLWINSSFLFFFTSFLHFFVDSRVRAYGKCIQRAAKTVAIATPTCLRSPVRTAPLFVPSSAAVFSRLVVSKMSAAAVPPSSRRAVVFGTSQDRRLFPLYFAPDRLGNEMFRQVAPDLGPGSYDSHKVGVFKCRGCGGTSSSVAMKQN